MKKVISNSAEETKKVGKELAQDLASGDVLMFYGNLGAGKTTFIQGLAEGMGIKDRILSPTFVLQRSHDVKLNDIRLLHHIDLYRIEGRSQIDSLGLGETLQDPQAVIIIEWAEKLENFKPERGYKIIINYVTDSKREIKIEKF